VSASDFGKRLRETRERLGMSQRDLTAAGLSKSYISLLESGHRQPSRKMADALAASLGVDSELLLFGIERSTRQERELQLRFAQLALQSGDATAARSTLEPMQRILDPTDPSRFSVEHTLALAYERCGDFASAVELLEQLRERAEADPARWPWLKVVIDLARCYREVGDLHRAVDVAERTMERVQSLGLENAEDFPRLVVTLAGASRERGDHTHASQLLSRLLAQLGQSGSRRDRGSALWNAALVAGDRGEYADGILLAERAIALFAEDDDDRAYGVLRTVLAWMLIEAGQDPEVAMDLLLQAHARLAAAGLSTDLAYTETELSRVCTALGQQREAIRWAQLSLERLEQGCLETSRARLALARALLASGEREAAVLEMRLGAEALGQLAASRQAAASWRELAELLVDIGDHAAAHDAYRNVARLLGLPDLPEVAARAAEPVTHAHSPGR
jgi:transcriptional regulator with XRE-family HTH domain